MNNALRASIGLPPVVRTAEQMMLDKQRKQRQSSNAAAHAQLQRDLKSKRGSRSK